MTQSRSMLLPAILVLLSSAANAQLPPTYWEEYLRPYDDELLYVHSLVNYAFDLQWQFEWEQRQLAGNALRGSGGSVAADDLLIDMDVNINQPLNDKWRFQGRYTRRGFRQRAGNDEQLLVGMERSVFASSAVYLAVNPEHNKEYMDIGAGYTYYSEDRQQYARLGVFLEDFTFDQKNRELIVSEQEQVALQWQVRLGLGHDWYLYSEGEVGNGFDRYYTIPANSAPDVARDKRRENSAELRVSRLDDDGRGWSAWAEWYDYRDEREFRQPGYDYVYENTIVNASAEHVRIVGDRHRWRFLLHYVDQRAGSVGYGEHDYRRNDILGGVFYEYLWPDSGATLAYAFGRPDIEYVTADPSGGYPIDSYTDKIIAGWRHAFSTDAYINISLSHELSNRGFGGGSIQFQMFF